MAIALGLKGEQSAKRRTLALFVDQLLFGGEGEKAQVLRVLDAREVQPRGSRFLLIEFIVRNLAQERAKAAVLQLAELVGGERLKLAIVEVHFVVYAHLIED